MEEDHPHFDLRRAHMAVLMILEVPGGTTAQYDRTNEILGVHADDSAPEGLVSHVCGITDGGIVVIDVWESQEALDRFFQQVGPAAAQAGMPEAAPRVLPVHGIIPKGAGTSANVIMLIEPKGFGPAEYDRLIAEMDAHALGGENHPAVSHVAAIAESGGLLVVDLWQSEEAFFDFARAQLAEAAAELGPLEPRFVPVYNRIRGRAPAAA
jgi:heme-degrading monooxygenase HmoA